MQRLSKRGYQSRKLSYPKCIDTITRSQREVADYRVGRTQIRERRKIITNNLGLLHTYRQFTIINFQTAKRGIIT